MTYTRVEQGALNGVQRDGVSAFLGIPYAAAPVGDLRWRPPEPPRSWPGVRDATTFGAAALQTVGASFDLRVERRSEDSLFVNVWTIAQDPSAKQPVMVWIHGGGNLGGAGSEDACDGQMLARRGVTVVTFNYRLGAFGFLAHERVGANFAVLDQVAALRWVHTNVAVFGGDPDRVTIFGQSAGAWAVRTLLSTPSAHGLFHRAVLQSAGYDDYAFQSAPTLQSAHRAGDALFDRLGSRDPETLRRLPAEAVLKASDELNGTTPVPGRVHTPANLTWSPVADGTVVAADGFPGCAPGVPVLLGWVANEARYFLRPAGRYDWDLVHAMAGAFADGDATEAVALLRQASDDPYAALDTLFTTAVWVEPALATLTRFAGLGRLVYPYRFTRVSPAARANGDLARHTCEIRYIFNNLRPGSDYDATDHAVADTMQQAWISFARTGVPSTDAQPWLSYNPDAPLVTDIGDDLTTTTLTATPLARTISRGRGLGFG